jgi:transporter family-2 protein
VAGSFIALLIVVVGVQFAAQAPINGGLGRSTGPLAAALVSNTVGTTCLLVICLLGGWLAGLGRIDEVPAWELAGGLIGGLYVGIAAISISRIGAGVVAAATITGQLACSVVVDHFGWFGIEVHDVSGPRVLGLLLLLGGALAMVYSREEASATPAPGGSRRVLYVPLVLLISALVGIQHPINSELATHIGDFPAGFMNFAVGTVLLAVLVVASGKAVGLRRVREAKPYYFLGGPIGVITVVSSLAAVTEIGAAGLTSALVTGQLIGALVLDRIGAFGLPRVPINWVRLVAVAALLGGTFLATA